MPPPMYVPPTPQYGVIVKCEVEESQYGKLLLITNLAQFHENVKSITPETDRENYWTIHQALFHGIVVHLFPIREETPEQWEPAFPLMCVNVWEFVGPYATPELALSLTKSWMRFADENCKLASGTRLFIRGTEQPEIPSDIKWNSYPFYETQSFKPE